MFEQFERERKGTKREEKRYLLTVSFFLFVDRVNKERWFFLFSDVLVYASVSVAGARM
jgi:hypothetical protein